MDCGKRHMDAVFANRTNFRDKDHLWEFFEKQMLLELTVLYEF